MSTTASTTATVALTVFLAATGGTARPVSAAAASTPLAAGQPSQPSVRSRGQLLREILPSNVRVVLSAGGSAVRAATGVVIATEQQASGPVSYVMTNAHVVSLPPGDTGELEVVVDRRHEKPQRHPARVVATGEVPDQDLAVLEVPGLRGTPALLAGDDDMELGDDVVAIGAPFGRGLSVSSGIVSQLEWDPDGPGGPIRFKTDAPIAYGASGGGIFRVPDGKLLALVEGYRTARLPAGPGSALDIPMPGETFAAPVAKIRRFLAAHGLARLGRAVAPAAIALPAAAAP